MDNEEFKFGTVGFACDNGFSPRKAIYSRRENGYYMVLREGDVELRAYDNFTTEEPKKLEPVLKEGYAFSDIRNKIGERFLVYHSLTCGGDRHLYTYSDEPLFAGFVYEEELTKIYFESVMYNDNGTLYCSHREGRRAVRPKFIIWSAE